MQHSWRCAGESVGAGLIYRDVRLLGEGRVQLGLILAQQGCQRAVASSPLTSGRGAAGPRRERNRAGVTPGPGGARPLPGSREGTLRAGLLVPLPSSSSSARPVRVVLVLCVKGTPPCRDRPCPPDALPHRQPPPGARRVLAAALAHPRRRARAPPRAPYLRRRWSGLLQGPPENRRWLKGAEGGRLFTASSHGRIGDVGRRMGARAGPQAPGQGETPAPWILREGQRVTAPEPPGRHGAGARPRAPNPLPAVGEGREERRGAGPGQQPCPGMRRGGECWGRTPTDPASAPPPPQRETRTRGERSKHVLLARSEASGRGPRGCGGVGGCALAEGSPGFAARPWRSGAALGAAGSHGLLRALRWAQATERCLRLRPGTGAAR